MLYLDNMLGFFLSIVPKVSKMKADEDSVEFEYERLDLSPNPRYSGSTSLWGKRTESIIDKIIVHQALGEIDTIGVHNYHISEKSHLKKGGAPKIAYHFSIEKSGKTYLVNDLTDVVWHCKGQNLRSIGILVCGDFDGPNHVGKSSPTEEQLKSLKGLLDRLTSELSIPKKEVYGHCDFGKPACPGWDIHKFILKYGG